MSKERILGLCKVGIDCPWCLAGEGKNSEPQLKAVDSLDDLCWPCLMDLKSEDLEEWGRLQSNVVDNLTSIFFHT